jgi:hypothetical protein
MNATFVDTILTILLIIWLISNFSCGFLTFVKRKISLENLWIFTGISTLVLLFTISMIKLIGWI